MTEPSRTASTDSRCLHGFSPSLTSFVGRADQAEEVADLLAADRLVVVTGPGGVGKTRLAAEVASRVAGRFADGAWLVELAAVLDPARVAFAVATALGIRKEPGRSLTDSLAEMLARRQLLLVLDNCEHVAGAAAGLCGALLPMADDLRILATSRDLIGVAGEVRYRVPPLALPQPDEPPGGAECAAVALFVDRARHADPHFVLDGESRPAVAGLVSRLDGMPLAIELAAARVEALGARQLLDRLGDGFRLLVAADQAKVPRQRSLEATVQWSYDLLTEPEQRVFRHLAVFPGPFTLEAAEAVAGSDSGPVVLRLVDCSLIAPPRPGPDGRQRYLMLGTLRAFGSDMLGRAEEADDGSAALAGHALDVATDACARMLSRAGERDGALWLDAEDATVHAGLEWALEHDRPLALRLALALAPWWRQRGRWVAGTALLRRAMQGASPGGPAWRSGQFWLGRFAHDTSDFTAALGHFAAVCDDVTYDVPTFELVDCLAGKSGALCNLDRVAEAFEAAQRALLLARQLGYAAGEAFALTELSWCCNYVDDSDGTLQWARQAQRIVSSGIPDWLARKCGEMLTLGLMETGQPVAASEVCAQWLARARDAGDLQDQADCLWLMAELDLRTGKLSDAGAHVQESLELATQTGDRLRQLDCLDISGHLAVATGRWADAVTFWTAFAEHSARLSLLDLPQDSRRRQDPIRRAERALGVDRLRAAEERGLAMPLHLAVQLAVAVTTPSSPEPEVAHGLTRLSAREQELVTLVAQGRTDAQIAEQLYISVSTVRSHLDRIRDKTGCRRRADLTRLALQAGMV